MTSVHLCLLWMIVQLVWYQLRLTTVLDDRLSLNLQLLLGLLTHALLRRSLLGALLRTDLLDLKTVDDHLSLTDLRPLRGTEAQALVRRRHVTTMQAADLFLWSVMNHAPSKPAVQPSPRVARNIVLLIVPRIPIDMSWTGLEKEGLTPWMSILQAAPTVSVKDLRVIDVRHLLRTADKTDLGPLPESPTPLRPLEGQRLRLHLGTAVSGVRMNADTMSGNVVIGNESGLQAETVSMSATVTAASLSGMLPLLGGRLARSVIGVCLEGSLLAKSLRLFGRSTVAL